MRAFIFTGQGSQFAGMGKNLKHQELFDEAKEILGFDLRELCFNGPKEELTKTENAQPAIFIVNHALFLEKETAPDIVAGHSLGEYSALCAANVFSFRDGLKLVRLRGELTGSVIPKGIMAVVIGELAREKAEKVCAKEQISLANINCPTQVVISGEKERIYSAAEELSKQGLIVKILEVGAAFHSDLMSSVKEEFEQKLNDFVFSRPEIPILFNATADYAKNPEEIRRLLVRQLVSPVRWQEIIQKMGKIGIDDFVEIGPKNILTPLVQKILDSGK